MKDLDELINEAISPEDTSAADMLLDGDRDPQQVHADAREVKRALGELAPPTLTPAQRSRLAGNARLGQVAVTSLAERVFSRSPRVAQRAGIPVELVRAILAMETAVGEGRAAVWPMLLHAGAVLELDGKTLRALVDDLSSEVSQSQLGQEAMPRFGGAQREGQRQERSDRARLQRQQRQREQTAAQVERGRQRLAKAAAARQLTEAADAAARQPRLPGKGGKTTGT